MYKPTALTLFLILTLFADVARAQDVLEQGRITGTKRDTKVIKVAVLDGGSANVKIIPDYVHRELKMVLSKDTLRIVDFWGVPPDINLLNKNFIRVDYAVRGGSNLGLANTMILCVNNGRLFQALHCLRYSHWETEDTADYNIKLALSGNNISNYKLKVNVHDDVKSLSSPETNFNYNDETVLSFDVKNKAFYSVKQILYENFIKKVKGKSSIKQEVNGTVPLVILGRVTYYLIGRKWYETGRGGELSEIY